MKISAWPRHARTAAVLLAAALVTGGAFAVSPHLSHGRSEPMRYQAAAVSAADGSGDSSTASSSPGDESLYVNTAGVYIVGHPVDINNNLTPCYPSIPGCPQSPLVPNTYGWQPECSNGGSGDLTDGCGYLFDNSTSSLIVRYWAAGSIGALSALCGPAAPLCAAIAGGVGLYLGDHPNIVASGRCIYLHAPDITNLSNLITLPSIVQARIIDCP